MKAPVIPEMFRSVATQVHDQGWTIEATDKHLVWLGPDGARVISSATPSDRRCLLNHKALLRQHGAVIDGRGYVPGDAELAGVQELPQPEERPARPETAGPPEADELRELISEARGLLRDLRQEKKDTSEWLSANIREVVEAEATRLCEAALAGMDKRYTAELTRVINLLEDAAKRDDQIFQARMADANPIFSSGTGADAACLT